MKKSAGDAAQLTPEARGWQMQIGDQIREAATLEEAIPFIPAKARIHLAAPMALTLLERLTLPATDPEELAGMVQLQLEKTLPYPVEEVVSDFEVLHQTDTDSTVLSIAVHTPGLEQLCQPLRDRRRIPEKITIFAQHVAANCPPSEAVLAVWAEQGHAVVAICENAKLSWAHTLADAEPETLAADLPRLLLSAEMEGVSTVFSRALVTSDCVELEPTLREALELPVETLVIGAESRVPGSNLVPPEWHLEARRAESGERMRQRIVLAVMLYLLLVAGAFLYLAWTKRRVQQMYGASAEFQPQLAQLEAMQSQWKNLAPAIEPRRFAVEVLYLVNKARPNEDVRITIFDYGLTQFMVEGEAPSAALAVDFGERLRKDPEISAFQIEAAPPTPLPNEHAQFRIFGKL